MTSRSILSALTTALLIASAPVLLSPRTSKPLSKDQIVSLLKKDVPGERIADLVKKRGINFPLTEDTVIELHKAGANEVLVKALGDASPVSSSSPLSADQILALVTKRLPSNSIAALVHNFGINFSPTPDYLRDLKAAGAKKSVLTAVLEAKRVEPHRAVTFGNSISAPKVIYQPRPEYTPQARKAKRSGMVVLSVMVDAEGNVSDARVVRRLGLGLDEKAEEAVKTWKFEPAMRDNVPVPVRVMVEVMFKTP